MKLKSTLFGLNYACNFEDFSINFCISMYVLKYANHLISCVTDYSCFGEVTIFCLQSYNFSKVERLHNLV